MEFDEDEDDVLQTGAFSEGHAILMSSPFGGGQTSLTPPPASSVLRHSSPPHRSGFFQGAYEKPVLITAPVVAGTSILPQQQQQQQSQDLGPMDVGTGGAAVAVAGGRTIRTRPSSQMTVMPKDYVDSGCDSTGGPEHPYATTASNATTLNPSSSHQHPATNTTTTTIKGGSINSQQQQQHQQQTCLYSLPQQLGGGSQSQHQKSLSSDNDLAMTMSTYDNGPTIVSLAQVQKVDLEGLRQSHHQNQLNPTPPSHSHHLGMVAVESPFA
jgi:hypothetical protein